MNKFETCIDKRKMCTEYMDNNIECGRIYVNKNKKNKFCINCSICRHNFEEWPLFTAHVYLAHNRSSINMPLQDCERIGEDQNRQMTCERIIRNSTYADIFIGESVVDESEGALLLNENLSRSSYASLVSSPRNAFEEEQMVNLEVEILSSFPEGEKEITQGKHDNENETENAIAEPATSYSKTKTTNSTKRCFFKLRATEPLIIFGFIDIIRRHPCQWDLLDYHHGQKEESLREICKELKENFKICISPQLARSSILSLIRWFEREYLRSMQISKSKRGRWSRDGYICVHPAYFKRLFAFLPHKHLQLVCCEICKGKFKTQNQLLVHNYKVHGGKTPFNCRHCKRVFLHASTWKHHENRHTKVRVWRCPLCTYISSTKTDYNLHMVTHTDIRAYVCDLCGASYKSNTSLNVHLRTHQPPKLQCCICHKKFYENYRLKRHLSIHEAEEAATEFIST